jgi:hypothetical protein
MSLPGFLKKQPFHAQGSIDKPVVSLYLLWRNYGSFHLHSLEYAKEAFGLQKNRDQIFPSVLAHIVIFIYIVKDQVPPEIFSPWRDHLWKAPLKES